MRLQPWQSRVLRVLGTAALVTGIFWFIPVSEVVDALRGVRLEYVAAGFALNLLVATLEAFQLWLLLDRVKMPISAWKVLETKLVTRFYGQFLPSELLASAVKFHRLASPTKQWGEVAAALAFFRLLNMFVLVVIGLAFWAIEMPSGAGRWVGAILFGMAGLLAVSHIVLVSPALGHVARRVFTALPTPTWVKGKYLDAATNLIRTAAVSYRLFGSALWPVALIALVRHGLGIVSFGLVALSLGVQLSYLTIGWIRVVLQALMMLPISLSGIGVREGSLVILLQEYAVPANQAIALAFILFITHVLTNSLGGLLELKNFLRLDRGARLARTESK